MLDKIKFLVQFTKLNQRKNGFALVVTLLLMVSISLIGLLALMNASTETLITRNEKEQKIAFQLAEAGLNEAYARVHVTGDNYIGEPSGTTTRTVSGVSGTGYTQTYTTGWNSDASNDFGYNKTKPTISGMSMAATNNYSVTIRYLVEDSTDSFCKLNAGLGEVYTPPTDTRCSGGEVVLFGEDYQFPSTFTPKPPSTGRNPVYKITSEATYGNTSVSLYSYIPSIGLNVDPEAAVYSVGDMNTNGNDTFNGNVKTCGSTDADNYIGAGGGGGSVQTNGTVTEGIPAAQCINMANFIGYSQSELWSMADVKVVGDGGATLKTTVTDSANADKIIFVDNDAVAGPSTNTTASDATINSNQSGSGILIISGNLNASGGFTWTGLIYVYGELKITGTVNVIGAVMSGSTSTISGNVNATYDQDVLNNLGKKNSTSNNLIRWSRQ